MVAAHAVLGLRGDARDVAAEPADDVQVLRGEVLDDADVADAIRERADALGGDHEHLPELALADAPAQLDQRGVEALHVPDGAVDAGGRVYRYDDAGTPAIVRAIASGTGWNVAANWARC